VSLILHLSTSSLPFYVAALERTKAASKRMKAHAEAKKRAAAKKQEL
jgi:hypothetical protein